MEIMGMEQDMAKMFALTASRAEKIESASAAVDLEDQVKKLVKSLHPENLKLKIDSIVEETETTRTFRFVSAETGSPLPAFRAGQYLSLKVAIDDTRITRPYSISSAPQQAESFYELTIRYKAKGFLTDHIWNSWKSGTVVEASGPHGNFYHDPLRDKEKIIALAGGSGITPFRSMIRSIINSKSDQEITLIYGSRTDKDIIFEDELTALAEKNPQIFKLIHIISEPSPGWKGLTGFIDSSLIREVAGKLDEYSYFICGPEDMYRHCLEQLSALNIPPRLIRQEISGSIDDITRDPTFPKEMSDKLYTVKYQMRGKQGQIETPAVETLLAAFEKAGLAPDSQCRSGECGFCRSLLLSGEVFINSNCDGRRAADLKYNFIHPCSTYPLSDLEVVII